MAKMTEAGCNSFEDCKETKHVDRRNPDYTGVAPYTLNPENGERRWDVSMTLMGAREPLVAFPPGSQRVIRWTASRSPQRTSSGK